MEREGRVVAAGTRNGHVFEKHSLVLFIDAVGTFAEFVRFKFRYFLLLSVSECVGLR